MPLACTAQLCYGLDMPVASSICGVILAAGFSTRMGRDKALLPWPPVAEGTPVANTFLGATIDMLQSFADLVIVVAGRNAAAIGPVTYAHGGFLIVNPAPENGQFSSLRLGLHEVLNRGRDAALVALIDRPPVLPRTLQSIRDNFMNASEEVWAVVPELRRGEERLHGHPIVIGREMMEAFLRAPLDATAREIEHQYTNRVQYVALDDPRIVANIDTPADYERLSATALISSEKQF